jgi:hypothetical protein
VRRAFPPAALSMGKDAPCGVSHFSLALSKPMHQAGVGFLVHVDISLMYSTCQGSPLVSWSVAVCKGNRHEERAAAGEHLLAQVSIPAALKPSTAQGHCQGQATAAAEQILGEAQHAAYHLLGSSSGVQDQGPP